MAKFTFVPYSVRVRNRQNSQYLKLDITNYKEGDPLIRSDSINFLKVFENFLNELSPVADVSLEEEENDLEQENDVDESDDEDIEVEDRIILRDHFSLEDTPPRRIKGSLFSGNVEESARVTDPKSNKHLYTIPRGSAVSKPFYFRAKVSNRSDKGILILQTFNKYAIKEALYKGFSNFIKKNHPDFVIEIDPFVPKELVEYYLNQRVIEIRLIKFGFPSELIERPEDAIPLEEPETIQKGATNSRSTGTSSVVLQPPRGENFHKGFIADLRRKTQDFINPDKELTYGNRDEIRNLVEVKNFTYDNIKLKVKIGKSTRTINLASKDTLKYNEELDRDLEIDQLTGYPVFESIDRLGKTFIDNCAKEIWGGQLNEQINKET